MHLVAQSLRTELVGIGAQGHLAVTQTFAPNQFGKRLTRA